MGKKILREAGQPNECIKNLDKAERIQDYDQDNETLYFHSLERDDAMHARDYGNGRG
jgi:hypothetical protein